MRSLAFGFALSLTVSILITFAAVVVLVDPVSIIGDFVTLRISMNPGVAFGVNLPSPWQEVVILTTLIVVAIVAMRSSQTPLMSLAFGFVLGGAIVNLGDRFIHGAVTDYISIGTFPIFNAADSFISIGALLLLIEMWRFERSHPSKQRTGDA